jgi:carbon-monoxide dehydrogenase medium subunit
MMKLRLAAPRFVIDLGKIRGLDSIREENGALVIGAMTTHAEVESSALLREKCPLLCEAAAEIGDVQVRNRGTLGGSLAHADPAADYPAAILALDAEIVASNSSGTRRIPAASFFQDLLTTALRPGEILTEVRIPAWKPFTGSAYRKLHQPASGFAIVGVAAKVVLGKGKIEQCAVGVTGVGPKAYRAAAVEKALAGKKPSAKLLADASGNAARGTEILSDLHASRDYRREMASVFVRRALERAVERAAGKKA